MEPPSSPVGGTHALSEEVRMLREDRHLPWLQVTYNLDASAGNCQKWISYATRAGRSRQAARWSKRTRRS